MRPPASTAPASSSSSGTSPYPTSRAAWPCALLRTIDTFRLFEKVNVLTGGGPAGTTTTITQFLYTYGIKSLDFGFGSAGAIVMTLLVLILSSFYIKRAMG